MTYKISHAADIGITKIIGKKSKVDEALFLSILKSKVTELVFDNPTNFEETYQRAKDHLSGGKTSLIVVDVNFEVQP